MTYLLLCQRKQIGAANETRTRDIHVGNVMLYQLSYSRIEYVFNLVLQRNIGAANETRTRDIHVGNVMLYQLSYSRLIFGLRILAHSISRYNLASQ